MCLRLRRRRFIGAHPRGENDPETFVGQLARRYRSLLFRYRLLVRTANEPMGETRVRFMIESLFELWGTRDR